MSFNRGLYGLLFLSSVTPIGADSGIYEIPVNDIDGNKMSLSEYKGKVLLIVNVASKCGFTYQYEGLEKLYESYKEKGLVILGFPANEFGSQEPGTDEEIKEFCSLTYGVSFPMFSKIIVKGADMHPLYTYLTEKETNPGHSGEITWNFNKFLISGTGEILNRFDTKAEPESEEVTGAVESALEDLGA